MNEPTKEEIEAAKGELKPTTHKKVVPIKSAIPTKLKQEAAREHKEWKKVLHSWIDNKSRIQWYADGSWKFILPAPLVKMVWQTTLQERIKYVKLQHKGISEEQAVALAVQSVNAELDGTAKTIDVIEQRAEQVKADKERKADEEEAKARDTLARMREELVKGKLQ